MEKAWGLRLEAWNLRLANRGLPFKPQVSSLKPQASSLKPVHLFALLFLLVMPLLARADVIHLKNGKVLHGEVVKEDPDFVIIKVPSGEIKLRQGDIEAIEKQSPVEYRLDMGRQFLQQCRFERAILVFEEAYLSDRTSNEAACILANAYVMQGKHCYKLNRFREARNAYEKLLKLDPREELFSHGAAHALKELGNQEQTLQSMTEQARALMKAGDWQGAMTAFENTIGFSADVQTEVGAEIAQCYIKRAEDHCRNDRTLNATADLESALRLDPRLSDGLEKFYVSCALPGILNNIQRGEPAAAQVDLRRVMEFTPTNPSVLYLAGRLEEASGRRNKAAMFYAQALHTRVENPTLEFTDELRGRLEKTIGLEGNKWKLDLGFAELVGFASVDDGASQKLETEHFTIIHYNVALAGQVAETAEYHRARVMATLNLTASWKNKAKIYLHRTQAEYTARSGLPEWTGGSSKFKSDGGHVTHLETHTWQTSPRLLKSVLPHEITHLVVYANLANPTMMPKCFHEAFAVLMEPQFRHDYFLHFLQVRLKSQDFIPLSELLEARDYPRDPDFFYAESFAIVKFIAWKLGNITPTVSLIKGAVSPGYANLELLKLSRARSLEELEMQWKDWILASEKK